MKREDIGKIIYTLRMKQSIWQEDLCRGICTDATLSRIELGKRTPDKLLLDCLLQRLGKSPDKLDTILTEREYVLYSKREEIEQAILQYDLKKARQCLGVYQEQKEAEEILQQQYIYKIEAILLEEEGGSIQTSTDYLLRAINLTVPGWTETTIQNYLLSVEEIQLLLMYARNEAKLGKNEKAIALLQSLVSYTEIKYSDDEEKVKIYPKCAYMLASILAEEKQYSREIEICEKAVKLLTSNGVIYYLFEILNLYIQAIEQVGNPAFAVKLKRQRESLLQVYQENGVKLDERECNIMLVNTQHELYLCNEVIREERISHGFSQQELCADICAPETMSRIESGKRSPSRKNFNAIMERLGVEKLNYNSYISAENFEEYETMREINLLLARHENQKAAEVLNILKKKIHLEVRENKQYVLSIEAALGLIQGKLTVQEALRLNEQALECTIKNYSAEQLRIFSKQEIVILNQIASCYRHLGKPDESAAILEQILKSYDNSKVDFKYHYTGCMVVLIHLSTVYEEIGRLDEGIAVCNKGIQLALRCGRGTQLGVFLANKASILEKKAEKKTSAKYFEQAFYLSDLMLNEVDKNAIDNYYRSKYDSQMEWY